MKSGVVNSEQWLSVDVMRNTSTLPCSSILSEISAQIFLILTIGYFPRVFLTQILRLFLAVLSPSQTFSVITVLSDLYKSQSSSLCHYFLTSSSLQTSTTFSLFPNTWNLWSVVVSAPKKRVGKTIILYISSTDKMKCVSKLQN